MSRVIIEIASNTICLFFFEKLLMKAVRPHKHNYILSNRYRIDAQKESAGISLKVIYIAAY
jgi:hypothetical protein